MLVSSLEGTDSFSSGGLLLQSWLPGLFAVTPVLGHGMMWVFPKIGVPHYGWFIMENPIQVDAFLSTPDYLTTWTTCPEGLDEG